MAHKVIKLRDYQQAAIDALVEYFMHNDGNPLVVLPTGAGKSHVIAAFVKLVMTYPNQRVMMLTHVKELIEQNYLKLMDHWEFAPAGVYSAGLKSRDKHDDIIFAGIQSVHKKANEFGRFDLILIDECHLISPSSNTMYRRFIDDQKRINPYLKLVGLTATPFRTSSGDITTSEGALFNAIAYEKPMIELINEGYLSPLVSKRTVTEIDLSQVHTRGGEFINSELQAATDKEAITQAAVQEIIGYGQDRQAWLIFCAGVDHAVHVKDELVRCGISAAVVTGNTPSAEREQILNDYKSGVIKAISNCDVLTTGFDAPNTDLIALLRGTQSPGLYVQMVGRGTRLAENKANCLVLDFAGNVMRHGPVDQVRPWTPSKKQKGEAPSKTCTNTLENGVVCNTIAAASAKKCAVCGFEFPFEAKAAHNANSDNSAIMSTESLIATVDVNFVHFNLHYKRDADPSLNPPTIRVNYVCGIRSNHKEWIPVFHDRFAKNRAMSWWAKFVPGVPFPEFEAWVDHETRFKEINALLNQHYVKPKALVVNESGKYPRIINYILNKNETENESDNYTASEVEAA